MTDVPPPPPPPSGGVPSAPPPGVPSVPSAPPPPPSYGSVPPPPPPSYGAVPSGAYAAGPGQLPPGVQIASAGKRFGGMLLSFLLMIVTLFIGYLIWAIIAWTKGTTPAKQVLKMRVVDTETMQPAATGKMWIRQFVLPLAVAVADGILVEAMDLNPGTNPLFGLVLLADLVLILTTARNQRIFDMLAKTVVVDDPNDAWNIKGR